jgi:hypothetical protein
MEANVGVRGEMPVYQTISFFLAQALSISGYCKKLMKIWILLEIKMFK